LKHDNQNYLGWSDLNHIEILNCAGNRESTNPGIGERVKNHLIRALKIYKVHKVNEKLCDLLYDKIKKFMWEISKYMSDRVLSEDLIERELEMYLKNKGEK